VERESIWLWVGGNQLTRLVQEWWNYTPTVKAGLQQVAEGHMDALRHWFFWT
jgi:hypothetical protein